MNENENHACCKRHTSLLPTARWMASSAPNDRKPRRARKSTGSSFHERRMARQKCTSRRRRWPRNAGQESNQKRLQHRVVDKHLARQRNRWLQARGRHARRTPVRVDFALIFISRICTPPFAQRFFWHIAAATVSGTAPSHNRIRSLASSSKSLRKYTESQPEVWTTLPVHASSV